MHTNTTGLRCPYRFNPVVLQHSFSSALYKEVLFTALAQKTKGGFNYGNN